MADGGLTEAAAVSAMRPIVRFIDIVSPGQAGRGIVDDAARRRRIHSHIIRIGDGERIAQCHVITAP